MKNEFTAVVHHEDGWFIAFSPEIPSANGQGRTKDEAIESLAASIDLLLEDLREEFFADLPPGAERSTVTVG